MAMAVNVEMDSVPENAPTNPYVWHPVWGQNDSR